MEVDSLLLDSSKEHKLQSRLTNLPIRILREFASLNYFGNATDHVTNVLHITPERVRVHTRNACKALGAKNRTVAVVAAISRGLFSIDDLIDGNALELETAFASLEQPEKRLLYAIYDSAPGHGFAGSAHLASQFSVSESTINAELDATCKKLKFVSNPIQLVVASYAYVKWEEKAEAAGWLYSIRLLHPYSCINPVLNPRLSVPYWQSKWRNKKASHNRKTHRLNHTQIQVLKEGASLSYYDRSVYAHIAKQMSISPAQVEASLIDTCYLLGVGDCSSAVTAALSAKRLHIDDLANGKSEHLESGLATLSQPEENVLLALNQSAVKKRRASNKDIASLMGMPIDTVKTLIPTVYSKIGVASNRFQLAVAAYRLAQKQRCN